VLVWNTLNREKNGSQEVKGYLRGGHRGIADRLQDVVASGWLHDLHAEPGRRHRSECL
jgi:hypothetical protein